MHDIAHGLVERVLPDVPIRPYVLSPPSELVGLLGARSEPMSALARIFVRCMFRDIERRVGAATPAHCGAVVVIQRFNKALERTFSPEFRNRLDSIITFGQLPEEVILMVVDKFINELDVLLAEKKVTIDLTTDARMWLREKGYSEKYGARPMGRVIQNEIKRPLADEILFGKLANGGHVEVDVEGEDDEAKLVMSFSETDGPNEAGPDSEKEEAEV